MPPHVPLSSFGSLSSTILLCEECQPHSPTSRAHSPTPTHARPPAPPTPTPTPHPRPPPTPFPPCLRSQAGITIASFGALRGCAATRDIRPGEKALSIPQSVLIYEDTVRQTDLVRREVGGEDRVSEGCVLEAVSS